ncbi:MAG: FKBP-type peptidyl-prolyl cis-trans isomerase [Clostridium sp.]|nr:FKBP-type peptidyl-prolyl cis-trans isomerase [Clostridium sp.]
MSRKLTYIAAVATAAIMAPVAAVAARPVVGPTPADSAATAVATVIGQYLRPVSGVQEKVDTAEYLTRYIDGVNEVLSRRGAPDPYVRGLVDGNRIAMQIADIESMGIGIDRQAFVAALAEALRGEPTGLTVDQANNYMQRRVDAGPQIDPEYAASQQQFLESQARREGVVKTPSGLLFEVVTEGEGESPTASDRVRVNYTGRLADGTQFDSSNGNPVTFGVSQLIPGFTEGLKMMKPGGTYRLFIPADLGYGNRGAGSEIPGGAALEFTVELVEILPQSK